MAEPAGLQNFKQVLERLTQFNAAQGGEEDIRAPLDGMNGMVGRLGRLQEGLKNMLTKISQEVTKMRAANLSASKERISQMTGAMMRSLNEIEKLVPMGDDERPAGPAAPGNGAPPAPPAGPQRGMPGRMLDAAAEEQQGGFQYSKSKSKSKSKSRRRSNRLKQRNSIRKTKRRR